MPTERLSPTLASHVALATILATEATGESAARCREAVTAFVAHARAQGQSEDAIAHRLTRAAGAVHHWHALLRQFGTPATTQTGGI